MKKLGISILILFTLTACTATTTLPVPTNPVFDQPVPTLSSPTVTETAAVQHAEPMMLIEKLADEKMSYYEANADGSDSRLIYSGDKPQMASLSPDGKKLAYYVKNGLYALDIESKTTNKINRELIGSMYSPIRWSPDGARLAMECAFEEQQTPAVCLFDVNTGQIEVLINQKNTDSFCATRWIMLFDWSQDASTIIYDCFTVPAQNEKQEFAIYRYDFATQTSQSVLDGTAQDQIQQVGNATISVDKNYLLITASNSDYISNLFLLDISSGVLTQLTHEPDFDFQAASWRSDNQSFVVYKSSRTAPYAGNNYVMDLQGNILLSVPVDGKIIQ